MLLMGISQTLILRRYPLICIVYLGEEGILIKNKSVLPVTNES